MEKKQTLSKLPPLIAKLKPTTKVQNDRQSESDGNFTIYLSINTFKQHDTIFNLYGIFLYCSCS